LRLIGNDQQWTFGEAGSALPPKSRSSTRPPGAWSPAMVRSAPAKPISTATGAALDLAAVTRLFVANLDVLDAMERGLARLAARPCACCTGSTATAARRAQHPGPLRPGQCPVRTPARPDHDVFGGAVRQPRAKPGTGAVEQAGTHLPEARTQAPRSFAGDRQRLGQPGDPRRHPYGCRVTTTTLSQAQYSHTLQRVKALGLERRITVLCEDYRDLRGRFDKLVSIEMIEAVGHRYLPTYFRQCARCSRTTA
jgi:cyclopropane-fatty-acyl-phospholipid synthase